MPSILKRTITIFIIFFSPGCTYITHHANVDPGFSVTVLSGVVYEQYDDCSYCSNSDIPTIDSDTGLTAHIQPSYGWKFDNGAGLQLTLPIYLSLNQRKSPFIHDLDIYWQISDKKIDYGVGTILGISPQLYFELGKRWAMDKKTVAFSAGSKTSFVSINPFAIATVKSRNSFYGLYLDHLVVAPWNVWGNSPGVLPLCDEECAETDYLIGQSTIGVVAGYMW